MSGRLEWLLALLLALAALAWLGACGASHGQARVAVAVHHQHGYGPGWSTGWYGGRYYPSRPIGPPPRPRPPRPTPY